MQEINWGNFHSKFYGKEQATFEWLAYLLFCKRFHIASGIPRFINHAGIETTPINVRDEIIGFQAKFYDTSLSSHEDDFIESINTAKSRHPDISKIIFYTNKDFGQAPKGTDPQYKLNIEKHASDNNISIEWQTASFFESLFVTEENALIAKYFFSHDGGLIDAVKNITDHSSTLIESIHSIIKFGDKDIKIDRSKITNQLAEAIKSPLPIILSGEGGVGKTAIIKDLFENRKSDSALFIFKASEFGNIPNLDSLISHSGNVKFSNLLSEYESVSSKCFVIDSAEKIASIENKEVLQTALSELIKHNWTIIFTSRLSYLDDLRFLLENLYEINVQTISVPNITDDNLTDLSRVYKFTLPAKRKMRELICNPFYLGEYLKNYSNISADISYSAFKTVLWEKRIIDSANQTRGMHIKRESTFLGMAWERAIKESFFVLPTAYDPEAIQTLMSDEIITRDKSSGGYFISHDIYEEWALERLIGQKYLQSDSISNFYSTLGDSLSIRRAFRHWLSSELLAKPDDIRELILATLDNGSTKPHWKDEALVSALLSDHASNIFSLLKDELLANDAKLLVRISFLLRIACKEIDESYLKLLQLNAKDRISLDTLYTQPKGSGWSYILEFINTHKELMSLKTIKTIIPLLSDWVRKYKTGEPTKAASQIALFYYKEVVNHGGFGYRSEDFSKKVIDIILSGSAELKDELTAIIDEVIATQKNGHQDEYYDLCEAMLSSLPNTINVATALPEKIIELATLFWIKDQSTIEDDYFGGLNEIEDAFGLLTHTRDYFPSSAYQTPILTLLRASPIKTIDFILHLTNTAVEEYIHSDLGNGEFEVVDVFINENKQTIQYVSARLWESYRGTHVSTSLLESVHMALEKWLIQYAKTHTKNHVEGICLYMLENTSSASISAVIASVACAYPDKTFKAAEILFKTKQFFFYDTARMTKDRSHKSSLEALRDNYPLYNYEDRLFQDERIEACNEKQRAYSLEQLAFQYQFFKYDNETDAEANARQAVIWNIFDAYYATQAQADMTTDADKTWSLYMARMDRRGMTPKSEEVDGKSVISFETDIPSELKAYSEESQKEAKEALKHAALSLWSVSKWRNDVETSKKYGKYEDNAKAVIKEVKQILRKYNKNPNNTALMFDRYTPAYCCSVLIRDFAKLSKEDRAFCSEVILQYIYGLMSFENGTNSDEGLEATINVLPLLLGDSDEQDEIIKIFLFFLLLDTRHVGTNHSIGDHAIHTIFNRLWSIDPDYAHSIFLGYLLLAPKYRQFIRRNHKEQYKTHSAPLSHTKQIEMFSDKFESDIEDIIKNRISYKNIPNLTTIDLHILEMAFKLLPNGSTHPDHIRYLDSVLPIFAEKLSDRRDRNEYSIDARFFDKFAHFILNSQVTDIRRYLKYFTDKFTDTRNVADLVGAFVSAEDRLHTYDAFWTTWEFLYQPIVKLCSERTNNYDTKNIIHNYLLAWPYWKTTAKEWDSLRARDIKLFKNASRDLGSHPAVLYSIAKLLNEIGSDYIDQGIVWISDVISKNANLTTEELEVNTLYNIEKIIRKHTLINREHIKKDLKLKKRMLTILDFLIEKGSVTGYLLREDLL